MNDEPIQFETPQGEALVLLPREMYLKLTRKSDMAVFERIIVDAEKAVAEGRDEELPGDVSTRLLLGDEHPLRVWREYRGLTQNQLAEKAGTGQDTISMIEKGKSAGRFDTMIELARALDIQVGDLVPARD